jgi:hypothetical protein
MASFSHFFLVAAFVGGFASGLVGFAMGFVVSGIWLHILTHANPDDCPDHWLWAVDPRLRRLEAQARAKLAEYCALHRSPARALVSPFPSCANTTFVRALFVGKGVECHPWLYCGRG